MPVAPPIRVLCVDDNRDAAVSLAELLEMVGFDTRFAVDGPSGLDEALTFRPDACVLDVHMPGMDGCELARRLRAAFGGRLFLVAVTGVTGGEFDRRVDEAGFDLRFAKPADPEVLVHALTRAAPAVGLPLVSGTAS